MAFVTIEVVPNPHGTRHHDVVIKKGNEVLATWSVPTQEVGECQLLAEIEKINKKHNSDTV